MLPTSETIWWLGRSIGVTRSTAARTARPVPSATITGVSERSVASSRLAAAFGDAGGGLRRGRIGRHHLAMAEIEALLQPSGQFHAGGDGMFEPEGDQPLGEAQRDQPLRRGARDLQHLCDLVLGVAGNEIEPAGPRGIVEPRFFVLGGHGRRHASFQKSLMCAKTRSAPAADNIAWPSRAR